MVNPSGVFVFFLKLGIQAFHNSEESTETPEDTTVSPTVDQDSEPMKLYWHSDIEEHENKDQPYVNIFDKNIGLDRIPDTTKEPIKELKYDFDALSQVYLPDALKTINVNAVPEAPKAGTGISNSGQNPSIVVGIVIGVLTGVIIVGALIAAIVYKHYVHHNVTSMNFDNPVYRKTTEDQFALEKNGYAPGSKLYPSTVGEEAQEPLNTPGTNDFV